jgi:hypothetical protein
MITLGGKPNDCSTDWVRFKEAYYPYPNGETEQWSVKIDK